MTTDTLRALAPGDDSPWGAIEDVRVLAPGLVHVHTAGHGGWMVHRRLADLLTPAARRHAFPGPHQRGEWLAFEEDCSWAILDYEAIEGRLGEAIRVEVLADLARAGVAPDVIEGYLRMWGACYLAERGFGMAAGARVPSICGCKRRPA